MTATKRPRGRPPSGLGPEYQEVAALYGTLRPAEIAERLGRSRSWVNSAVQRLRQLGAIDADTHVATGRAPAAAASGATKHVHTDFGPAAITIEGMQATVVYLDSMRRERTVRLPVNVLRAVAAALPDDA